ncbi:MAG TPA: hypothetical protein VHZ51_10040 [Ktedonobacteraceae bacterium]|nr:hypothetical protein [Ktedonobacteraceae bacterium]
MTTKTTRRLLPQPPPLQGETAIIHGDQVVLQHWLHHYWTKLDLPAPELPLLAITQNRREFSQWTAKRVGIMALGCYCYMPLRRDPVSHKENATHRHLIFIAEDMQAQSIEVTVAHELIHLADRVHGTPRRHHRHGYDAIAIDEAALTGYPIEDLRALQREEGLQRERLRRARRPIRYLYECPKCGKTYPRTRQYTRAVSCSRCDKHYNPLFRLRLPASS